MPVNETGKIILWFGINDHFSVKYVALTMAVPFVQCEIIIIFFFFLELLSEMVPLLKILSLWLTALEMDKEVFLMLN